jgi:hypothetical protein
VESERPRLLAMGRFAKAREHVDHAEIIARARGRGRRSSGRE